MYSMVRRERLLSALSCGLTKPKAPLLGSTKRSYTHYAGLQYPELKQYSYGYTFACLAMTIFFVQCGNVDTFTGRNEWRRHVFDGLDKYNGVINGDEFEYIDSFFDNLPDRAE
ncbi:hypothetical protein XU18_0557 [Perkinsela sp. CCAP 1560/4]|nr:hypothetical protein XU18_0557 [Perkinsela sp. CCAP 1560/4]|eukprot:KNH09279.1 hypothetical protein XU18_0557 [Perkinsela sp. CCAP 1560/4]